jgi:hypothetical protein
VAELKKHAWLLVIIAILASIKFLFIPILSWQDSIAFDIKNMEKRQSKIVDVLANQSTTTALNSRLSEEIDKINQMFYQNKSESIFKLSQQKNIEKLLTEHQLKSLHFGWTNIVPLDELLMTRYHLEIRVSGTTESLVNFFAAIEGSQQRIALTEFNISLKNQQEKSLGTITAIVKLQLFLMNPASEQS